MIGKKLKTIDPLYQLFEHHLVTRSYDDTAAFTKQLAEQYMGYLDSTPAHVPFVARQSVLEDLSAEAHEMLVKKMYGCVRTEEYSNYGAVLKVDKRNDQLAACGLNTMTPTDANPTTEK